MNNKKRHAHTHRPTDYDEYNRSYLLSHESINAADEDINDES